MKLLKITTVIAMSIFVSACAQQQQEEPIVIVEPEPQFDKYGNEI